MIHSLFTDLQSRFQLIRCEKILSHSAMFAALYVLASLLSGCTKEASTESVEDIATKLFASIQKKEFDTTLTFYGDAFYDFTPKTAWKEHLIEVNDKLGTLKKVKLKRKNTSTVFSGRRFVFVFANQYEKGLAKETVIFFQHVSKPEIKIQSHKIESSKLPGSQAHP